MLDNGVRRTQVVRGLIDRLRLEEHYLVVYLEVKLAIAVITYLGMIMTLPVWMIPNW